MLDNNGDIADPGGGASPRNSFADSASGVINAITQTDLRTMDAIGWTRVHGLDDHSQDAGTSAVLTDNVARRSTAAFLELQGDHDWFKVTLVDTKHYRPSSWTARPRATAPTMADPFIALYGGARPRAATRPSRAEAAGRLRPLISTRQ